MFGFLHASRATGAEHIWHSPLRGKWILLALLIYALVAVSLTAPALTGERSLLPEGFLDQDLLYGRPGERAAMRPFEDSWPVVGDLGRERAVAAGLHQGRFDSWNPWAGTGAPLWAEQGGPFFPTKLLYYLHPSDFTLTAALGSRLILGALGMFLLALAVGLSPLTALFAGTLLEYSGAFAANLPYSNTSAVYMLPWALLGAHKICTTPGPAAVPISALALGIALFGGHPSMALLVCIGFAAWIVGVWIQTPPSFSTMKRSSGVLAAAGVLAVLIAAVGLLPFLELVGQGLSYKSTDAAESIWRERLGWTRDVFGLAAFFPSFVSAARDSVPDHMWPWTEGASIGLAALFLAVVGIKKVRSHWGIVLIALAGIALTLAPIGSQWFHRLPIIRIILPWYCYPLIVVPVCIASAFGLQSLLTTSRRALAWIAVGLCLTWLVCVAFLFFEQQEWARLRPAIITRSLFQMVLGLDVPVDPLHFGPHHLADWRVAISPLAAALTVGVALLFRGKHWRWTIPAIALIALLEAAAIRIPTVTFERSAVLASGPAQTTGELQTALSGGLWRFVGFPPYQLAAPNSGIMFGLRDLRSFSALPIRRLTEFLELADASAGDPWKHGPSQHPATMNVPVLSLAAVRYVAYDARHRQQIDVPPDFREIDRRGDLVILENPYALARVRVARDVIPVDSKAAAGEELRALVSSAPGGRWERAAVIEGATDGQIPSTPTSEGARAGTDWVELLPEPDPQRVVIEADLASAGFLILADAFYPGWSATVDSVPTTIYPANLLFRAVYVPQGKHTIVMEYSSSWLRFGGLLTVVGLSIVVLLFTTRHRAAFWRRSNKPGGLMH